MKKPIKVFWSELGQRFYASDRYKQEGNHVTITGEKFDVTDDIAAAVLKHDITFSKDFTHLENNPDVPQSYGEGEMPQ